MILAHGKLLPDSGLRPLLSRLEEEINTTRASQALEAETVIAALDALGQRLDRGELDALIAQYAPPGAAEALAQVRPMLRREALEYRLAAELGPEILAPRPRPFGAVRPMPLGTLLHVAAGNVDGLPAFSVTEGLLTGNVNLLKLPRADKGLSLAILKTLAEQEPRLAGFIYAFDLPSSDAASLRALANLADGLVVWGGDEAVTALRHMAPPGCRLIEWGHRLSFAYVAELRDHGEELRALAEHIIRTDGLLCSSCQVIFLDTEDREAAETFCRRFLPMLEEAAASLHQSPGQAAQAALYARETLLEHIVDRGGRGEVFFPGRGCSLTLREDRELELSPLHGSVLVKCLPRAHLLSALRRQKGRLQTAGLICAGADRPALTDLLARAGVTRITRAGHMSRTFPGEGHDGEYPLRRCTRMVDIES